MKRKRLTKKQRHEVYMKYDGHCAYCGCELDEKKFDVDHFLPVIEFDGKMEYPERDTFGNLMPACKMCNFRKGNSSIENLRHWAEHQVEILRRDSPQFRFAELYGQVEAKTHSVEFYYELYNK